MMPESTPLRAAPRLRCHTAPVRVWCCTPRCYAMAPALDVAWETCAERLRLPARAAVREAVAFAARLAEMHPGARYLVTVGDDEAIVSAYEWAARLVGSTWGNEPGTHGARHLMDWIKEDVRCPEARRGVSRVLFGAS